MKKIKGGINSPLGYKASGFSSIFQKQKSNMALITSDKPCIAAGCFTTNAIQADPVIWDKNVLSNNNHVKGIVIISGIANSCTGELGSLNNYKVVNMISKGLNIKEEEVLIACTGVIGKQLPMRNIEKNIPRIISKLSSKRSGGMSASHAILTSDTFEKEICVKIKINDKKVTIAGMAKGGGVLNPNMATLLSFVTTDAYISKKCFQKLLNESVAKTYNRICIDKDISTNDSVIALANGMASNDLIDENHNQVNIFREALDYVNYCLAKEIVKDGEGTSRFLEVRVLGAKCQEEANYFARAITSSNLVRTSFFGCGVNWGSILGAMGSTKINFDPSKIDVWVKSKKGKLQMVRNGLESDFEEEWLTNIMKNAEVSIWINLKEGKCKGFSWGNDLTYDYVRLNSNDCN